MSRRQSVAQHGVIEEVTLTNFMCHKYVQINFGPDAHVVVNLSARSDDGIECRAQAPLDH